ncbi:MAG: hypothetical protein JXR03_18720 [Cyclobacteriaceae bacterium]
MRKFFLLGLLLISISSFSISKEEIANTHKRIYSILNSNPDEAYRLSLEAEVQAEHEGLLVEEANSIFIQGWIHKKKRNELGKAFILYLKALEVLKPAYDESTASIKLYVDLLISTGNLLTEHFAFDEAINYYDEAIKLAGDNDMHSDLSLAYWKMASAQSEAGKTNEALVTIESAIESAIASENEKRILTTINSKGLFHIELKNYAEARKCFNKIIDWEFTKASKNHFLGIAWHNVGHSYTSEGKHQDAIAAYKSSEVFKKEDSRQDRLFITWTDLSESMILTKDYPSAERYGLQALDIYDQVQLHPDNYRIYDFMSTIAFESGDFEKSRFYTEKYIEENDKFLKRQEEIQRTKDHYKMELLAAGFFMKVNSAKNENLYSLLLTIVSSLLTIALVAGATWQYWVRRSIKKSIARIEKDSFI